MKSFTLLLIEVTVTPDYINAQGHVEHDKRGKNTVFTDLCALERNNTSASLAL